MMKKNKVFLAVSVAALLLTQVSNAAVVINITQLDVRPNSGTESQVGLTWTQEFSYTRDFDGDTTDEILTFDLVFANADGVTIFTPPDNTQYPFTTGTTLTMSIENIDLTLSDGSSTLSSLSGNISSWFKAGNGNRTVTNGGTGPTDTYTQVGLNNTTQTFAPVSFSDSTLLTFTTTATNGYLTNLDLEFTTTVIPEPSTFALLTLGLLGLVTRRRRA